MAGHSKWANIRFRKAAQDAKRGKLFTRLIREVTVAARSGGGDPGSNPRLRTAVDKALAANMTRDNIERAIKRGTGEIAGAAYEEVRYEGYAQGGVAVMVECATDNRNRTVGEVRHAFTRHGGNLGTDGSVAYLFNRVGLIVYEPGADEARIIDVAAGAGAEDVETAEDGSIEVLTPPEAFQDVLAALETADLAPASAEITERAMAGVVLGGDDAERVMKLLNALEDLDDVQQVHTNAEFTDEQMALADAG